MIKPTNEKVQTPFMPIPSGYGYLGTLMYDDIEDKIQCHFCGEWFTMLAWFHLKKHELTTAEYKDKYGLNKGTSLMTPTLVERKIESNRGKAVWGQMTPEEFAAFTEHRVQSYKSSHNRRKKDENYGKRLTLETMNTHGSCPKQVEERFTKVVDELGRVPTSKELMERDPSLFPILSRRFKSYHNAVQYFGLKPNKRAFKRGYDREYLEELLKQFMDEKKRIPTNKDTEIGYLPHYQTLVRHFGTWKDVHDFCADYLEQKYPLSLMGRARRFIRGMQLQNMEVTNG